MDEADPGVDKDDILRQIAGAIPMEEPPPLPMEEGPLPDLPPPEPLEASAIPQEPLPPPAPEPAPEEARPLSRSALPIPSWWSRHRHEAAGLVTAAVALVWMSLGIAARVWAPCLLGMTFALGAFVIATQAVWVGD